MVQLQEVTFDELKHLVSDRALTGETMLLNMGPQHPSTHGVLRLMLELDGETIVNCVPDIGFLHTGVEKNMEAKRYEQAEVMTDRLDYLNTIGNNLAYCLAVEKLVELDVPPRAQVISRTPSLHPANSLSAIMPRVCSARGKCTLMKSALAKISSIVANWAP